MLKYILLPALAFLPAHIFSQCNTSNATSCICDNGTSTCELLPDITSSWWAILHHTTGQGTGPREYSQSGNGIEDGRLRISLSTPNIGHGPLTVRGVDNNGYRWFLCGTDTFQIYDPNSTQQFTCPNSANAKQIIFQRVYRKNGNSMSFYDRFAGTMTYHPTHGHNHVDDWGVYTLRWKDPNEPNPLNWPVIGQGSKIGFCLMDYGTCSYYNGHCRDTNITYLQGNVYTNGSFPNFGLGGGQYNCSMYQQGISSGWTDIYGSHLDGMWIQVPPGLCNGEYWIVADTDPNDYFLEEDETNNYTAVPFTLTQQNSPGNPVIKITPSVPPSICGGSSITLYATPGFSYLWNTGDTTQSITVSTAGSYTVTVTNYCGTGTSAPLNVTVFNTENPPVVQDAQVCAGTNAVLTASQGETVKWYNASGNWIHTGDTLITPSVQNSTFYTVVSEVTHIDTLHAGPPSNTFGSGAYNNSSNYLLFDAYTDFILKSVKIYTNSGGPRTFYVYDGSGGLMYDTTANLMGGMNIVNLNYFIPQGNDYQIRMASNSNAYINNSDVGYPYTLPGVVSIKNSSQGTMYYYFFYDWEVITQTDCQSPRDTVFVSPFPPVPVSMTPLAASYDILQGNVTLTGTPAGGVFSGPGVTGNIFDPAAAGIGGPYVIHYIYTDNNGCTANTSDTTYVFTSLGTFGEFDFKNQIRVYPNPAFSQINVDINLVPGISEVFTGIYDIVGKLVLSDKRSAEGTYHAQFDISHLAPGTYIVRTDIGGSIHSERIIVQ